MTEGTSTFQGLGVPLFGESEIQQQTAATDLLTLTGAASMSGDFLVLQNSSGAELLVVSASGALEPHTIEFALSSTVSTTHAVGFTLGASAVVDALFKYTAGITGATTSVFQVSSTNGPTYLLSVATSAGAGTGAAVNNGFFTASMKYISAPSTAIPMGGIKMLAGSKAYYIPCIPDTGMA
jgi:hypothetical protein